MRFLDSARNDNKVTFQLGSKIGGDFFMHQESQFTIVMKRMWPTISRAINGIIYFLVSIIKSVVKAAMDQFKGKM